MGTGVAEAAARAGIDVHVVDLSESVLERGRQRVITSIARAQESGKLTEYEAEDALSHIDFSAEMKSIRDSQLVIEAVIESEADKIAVFKQIDKCVKSPNAVL